jgi:hypothetical protein
MRCATSQKNLFTVSRDRADIIAMYGKAWRHFMREAAIWLVFSEYCRRPRNLHAATRVSRYPVSPALRDVLEGSYGFCPATDELGTIDRVVEGAVVFVSWKAL